MDDFFKLYFSYVGKTEVPVIFNRWAPIGCIAAYLSRQCWVRHGHWTIYPNMYLMLIGEPASRKTTAINLAKRILERTGFDKFAADKSSMQQFLFDFMPETQEITGDNLDEILDLKVNEPNDQFIVADEFTDFVGTHNLDFLVMLSRLYDCLPQYKNPKITKAHVIAELPTVSILSASQPEMLYSAFPPEAIGQGVMSRIVMIFAESTGEKIAWPDAPSEEIVTAIVKRFKQIKKEVTGEIQIGMEAKMLVKAIYDDTVGVEDHRFQHYNNRRFTHHLKLSMLLAALDCRKEIKVDDVVKANTLLYATEARMHRALGEFGRSRNSEIANKIIAIMQQHKKAVTRKALLKLLSNDLDSGDQLTDILKHMIASEKIRLLTIDGKSGYVPQITLRKRWDESYLDRSFLTPVETLGIDDDGK